MTGADVDLQATLRRAVALHNDGKLAEAERLYDAILAQQPGDPRALHLSGRAALGQGKLERALERLDRAIAAAPGAAAAHNDRAIVLSQLGRLEPAVASFRQALACKGDHVDAHVGLGNALMALGRLDEAVVSYRNALAIQGDRVDAHFNLGNALTARGRLDEAVASYRNALAIRDDHLKAHINLGNALMSLGRPDEAAASYRRALELKPDQAELHSNLGNALTALDLFDDAVAAYGRALAIRPDYPEAHSNLGRSLRAQGRLEEALGCFRRALHLRPDHLNALSGQGHTLADLGRFAEALATYERLIALSPDDADAHNGRGLVLHGLKRFDEALASYDRAVAVSRPEAGIAPVGQGVARKIDVASVFLNKAYTRLLSGDFRGGWRDYEHRWGAPDFLKNCSSLVNPAVRARLKPGLEIGDLAGRSVLIVAEQGVGDVVLFASLLPDLAAIASEISLVCDPRLHRLFAHSFPRIRVFDAQTAARGLPPFDKVLAIGSLGRLFRNRVEDFPGAPFLRPSPGAVERWAERLGPSQGRKRIGLSWRGGAPTTRGVDRSLPLAALQPIFELPGCDCVSLQYGDHREEVAAVNAALVHPVRLFEKAEIDDFEDLAALVRNLDLVVSVQTSLIHLCGAIGAPCLVMVPHNPEWRYGVSGPAMPWYRSVRLFRQAEDRAWPPVVRQVADEAASRLGLS